MVTNADGARRSDTAAAFLAQLAPGAAIDLRTGARVDRVRIAEGVSSASTSPRWTRGQPIGERLRSALQQIDAPLVVLAAGAVGSAELLLRSGVGPAEDLSDAGIPVRVDLPVGMRTWQHPVVELLFRPRPGAVASTTASFLQLAAHLDARGSGDVVEVLLTRRPYGVVTGSDPTDDLLSLRLTLMSAVGRGSLRLDPADPAASPQLAHALHPDDVAALATVRRAATWAAHGPIAAWVETWHGPDAATCATPQRSSRGSLIG